MLLFIRCFVLVVWFIITCVLAQLAYLLRPRHPSNSKLFCEVFCPPANWILGIDIEYRNFDKLKASQPCVFIGNHQHNLDVLIFGTRHPSRTISIGKQSIRWIPFFGLLYYLAGNLFIDRKNHIRAMHTMQIAREKLMKHNVSFIIFPEGTRSKGRGLGPFKKGPFILAIDAQVKIQPIVASSVHLLNWSRWNVGKIIVEALPAIDTKGKTHDDIDHMISLAHQSMQSAHDKLNHEIKL